MNCNEGEWRSELPSTLEAIEEFCVEFQRWRSTRCVGINPFAAELLLREALTNSVVHGCLEDPTKRIYCVLRAKTGRLTIAVRDEGAGFDWRAAWDRHADVSDSHGRGIEIYRQYANAVRFNPTGNAVTLIKRF